MGKYTRPISRQRLGKHVPTATNRRATVEVLLETGISTRSVPRSYLEDNRRDQVSSVREFVKRGFERVKLKNLHCWSRYQETSNVDTAGWRRLSV
jgi:hypothetical protein